MTFIRRFAAYGQSATQTAKMLSAIVSCAISTFDMWNKGWDKIFEENEWGKYPPLELVRFIARTHYQAPDRKAVKILEIGCGPGANLLYLAKEGFSAYGIDGSKVALGRAEQRLLQEGLNVALQQGDVMALPYDDASFDSVIDIECLYANSLADTKKIISEIHRVLRPGGSFSPLHIWMVCREKKRRHTLRRTTYIYVVSGRPSSQRIWHNSRYAGRKHKQPL